MGPCHDVHGGRGCPRLGRFISWTHSSDPMTTEGSEMFDLTESLIAELQSIDTPTVCNALEVLAPERRGYGYTTEHLFCIRPELKPMVGLARTATIRSAHPSDLAGDEGRAVSDGYYRYIGEGPKPSVAVVQDIDEQHGYGSLWGEVNSAIHSGLGCVGIVSNGGIRDLPEMPPASRCSPAGSSPRTLSSTWSTSGARSTSPGCGCAAATWSTLTSTARS